MTEISTFYKWHSGRLSYARPQTQEQTKLGYVLWPCSKTSFIVQIERLFGISPFLALKVLISTLSHVIVSRKELWCIQSAYCTALFTQTQTPIRNYRLEKKKYVQVNKFEIVINLFHISHNLTWYSEIVHKFTRISKVCSTY